MTQHHGKHLVDGTVTPEKLDLDNDYEWTGEHDFTGGVVQVPEPVYDFDAVPFTELLQRKQKKAVRVRATGNVDLGAPGATIDGVTMSVDDRVCCDQQTSVSQDGLYLWKGAAVSMVRTADAQPGDSFSAVNFFVEAGTFAGRGLHCLNEHGSDVIGTDDIVLEAYPNTKRVSNLMTTGLMTGGVLSINGGDNTKFDVAAGSGFVVNNYTDPENPTRTEVNWSTMSAITVTNLATADITYVALDSAGSVVQSTSRFTPEQLRDYILLGALGHQTRSYLSYAIMNPVPVFDVVSLARDFLYYWIPAFNIDGNVVENHGTDLQFKRSAGSFFKPGSNWATSKKNPNVVTCAAADPSYRYYAYRNAGGEFVSTSIGTNADPDYYDPGGGAGLVAVGSGKWTVQHIFIFADLAGFGANNPLFIQYGQVEYDSEVDAVAHARDTFTLDPDLAVAVYRGALIVEQGTTDLTNATFISAGKFGLVEFVGGGGGGAGEANTASNAGLAGVGIYHQKSGVDLQFKAIAAASNKVTVVNNGTNVTVDLDVTPGNIPHQDLSGAGTNNHAAIDSHIANTSNPHSVTKSQVGLGNVTDDAQIKSSDFPASSVDSEIALFSDTSGKSLKRATTSGVVKATAGVIGAATFNHETLASQVITGTDTTLTDTLDNTPISPDSVRIWMNGIFQEQGSGKDYTISGQTITWLASSGTAVNMDTDDDLVVEYMS